MNLSLNLSALDNKQIVAFGQSVYNISKDLNGIESALTPYGVSLESCINAINNSYEKTKAKEVSVELKNIDTSRDTCLVGFGKLVEAHEYHPDEKVQVSATKLSKLIDSLGPKVYNQSYDKESMSIKSLLNDLTGNYEADVKLVHGMPFVKALASYQSEFDTKREQQLKENAESSEIVTMSTLRKDFERKLRSILNIISAFYAINPSPEYKEAILLLQESIKKFR